MTNDACPHSEKLASFVRCELSEEVAANVLDHLDGCRHCEETVARLELTFKSVLPGAAATLINSPYAEESACQRAVKALVDEFSPPSAQVNCAKEPSESNDSPEPGRVQTVRDFRILEKVGQGGMGTVYKAVHQRMQRTVALKVLPSAMIGDQSAVARFSREMAVLGQLNHPNIVQAFDAGDDEGQHYLAMEFIDGQDVATVLRRNKRLSIANACLIVSQVASALQYAHEKGFVHRDIKPSNLMLANVTDQYGNPQAIVKVLDLGLARVFEHSSSGDTTEPADLTSAGQIMGTLDYMAPEQGSDSHSVDIRTDIYSLGATLYKLLTGEAPFAEHAGRAPLQRLMAIATQEIRPVTSRRPDVPDKLAGIVHRMLEKDPRRRFQTPAEVARALEEFTSGACLIKLLQPGNGTSHDGANLLLSSESHGGDGSRHRTSRRLLATLSGFAAFAIIAALLVINTRHGRIEVTSPDGKLPDDLRVVVLKGGEEVQILQAENQWTATVVNGEYEVVIKGGNDQFEVKESKLVVSRLGKAVCIVTHSNVEPVNKALEPANDAPSQKLSSDGKQQSVPEIVASVPLVDRDKPFVIVNDKGEQTAEFRFANEAFAASQSGVIEVHGNGPFRLGQVRREGGTLHIKAGPGYRPQFVVGFDLPDNNNGVNWFDLTQVDLAVDGCDFAGASADQFVVFSGTGGNWKFENCRLSQPYTRVGGVLRFDGLVLDAVNCQWFTPSPTCMLLDVRHTASVSLTGNRFLRGGYAIAVHTRGAQTLNLESNTFYGNRVLVVSRDEQSTDVLNVEARENELICSAGLIGANASVEPRTQLSWKGVHNRIFSSNPGLLWGFGNPDEPRVFETTADWNSYWGKSDDLETSELPVNYPWDLLNVQNTDVVLQHIATEIESARVKFRGLPELGPNMKLVGSGEAWNNAQRTADASAPAARPESLEGGPFVIIRDEVPLAGYISCTDALEHTEDGDIIEIRSDGPFPAVRHGAALNRRLTLRAATGYRPVLGGLRLNAESGDWTLEGLHIQCDEPAPAIVCVARRIANCSVNYSTGDGRVQLRCPEAAARIEIVNCLLSNPAEIQALQINVANSVLESIVLAVPASGPDSAEAKMVIENSCLYAHATPLRPNAGSAVSVSSPYHLLIKNSLIDADHVATDNRVTWSGVRNLYRTCGSFEFPPVQDEGSFRDESVILRQGSWRVE